VANRILVVDDEKLIVKGIKFSLEQDDMVVDCAYDGEEALEYIEKNEYDIILLDIMLPKLSGFEVCQHIREVSEVPIIMLTAKGDDMDKILGLEYGADDYITKPFNILEVKARIKAIIRRSSKNKLKSVPKINVISAGDMVLDKEGRRVTIKGKYINLTVREFDLLEILISSPNKVYSREMLLKLVWSHKSDEGGAGDVRTVDVHVRRLREKVEPNPSDPTYIHTKWGVGYYFYA
jgi:Response regulators consisting of a CheY-like receiver domain and a winged-helix DNA-binding domain